MPPRKARTSRAKAGAQQAQASPASATTTADAAADASPVKDSPTKATPSRAKRASARSQGKQKKEEEERDEERDEERVERAKEDAVDDEDAGRKDDQGAEPTTGEEPTDDRPESTSAEPVAQDESLRNPAEAPPPEPSSTDASLSAPPREDDEAQPEGSASASEPKLTMEERMAKLKLLRKKMAEGSTANRQAVAAEAGKHRQSAKHDLAQSRRIAKAERILDKRDALERGEDYERSRAWTYSIEENEAWEEKLRKKEEKMDKGHVDFNQAAARSYARQVGQFKPDLKSYGESQCSTKAIAPSSPGGSNALVRVGASGSGSGVFGGSDRELAKASLGYGEHRASDQAIDRVIGHLNMEAEVRSKRSRVRLDDGTGEVNYINKQNQHFNKKIKRFYDDYTRETRENLERGTAL